MSDVETQYRARFGTLQKIAKSLEEHLAKYFEGVPRIDRVSARAKSVESFVAKAAKLNSLGNAKYSEPLNQVQDQIGVRIITFYRSDVDRVSEILQKYFRSVEDKRIVPESDWEFGYFGKHSILVVPTDVMPARYSREHIPDFFEIQVKTLFQHAWSEANHDLGYKNENGEIDHDVKRRLAFTSAQAWGADLHFDEMFLKTGPH